MELTFYIPVNINVDRTTGYKVLTLWSYFRSICWTNVGIPKETAIEPEEKSNGSPKSAGLYLSSKS